MRPKTSGSRSSRPRPSRSRSQPPRARGGVDGHGQVVDDIPNQAVEGASAACAGRGHLGEFRSGSLLS